MAKYRKVVTKTVEEWLAIRQPRLGGSEISAVIGINPWESRYELYQRKTGEAESKVENMAMRLGHKLENAVAELLQEEAGYQVIKNTSGNLIYLSEDYPYAEASPDRLGYLPNCKKTEANKCIIEIKTTQKQVDADALPEHWICQVQWYMGITGIHSAVVAWLTSGRDFGYTEIAFDEEFFSFLASEGKAFMEQVAAGEEPEAITARDIAVKYPKHVDGKAVEVDEEVALACESYKVLEAQIKELETQRDAYKDVIKVAFQDAEVIMYGEQKLATFKAAKSSLKFDAKAYQEANPEQAKQYMRETAGSRRLVVK